MTSDELRQAFLAALRNSFGISLIATFLAVILATLAAYAIARLDFPGKRLVLSMALAIAMFPVVSLVGPLFDMWRTLGLFNTWPGLIIPYMTFTLPLSIWTLSAFFREIPWEMEQAAQVDGATVVAGLPQGDRPAGRARRVHHGDPDVLLRLERVRARASSLTSTTALAHRAGAAVVLRRASTRSTRRTRQLATASVIVTIPVVIIVLLFQRKIVSGLTSGAVKG